MSKRAFSAVLVAALLGCDEGTDRAPDDPGNPVDDLAVAGATDESGGTTDAGDTEDHAGETDDAYDPERVEFDAVEDEEIDPIPLVEDEVSLPLEDENGMGTELQCEPTQHMQ